MGGLYAWPLTLYKPLTAVEDEKKRQTTIAGLLPLYLLRVGAAGG